MPEYQKVLIIQLRQLGDIILSTPCIREIRRELPNAHISFLCHKMGKQVLEGNPNLDELIYYHEKDSYLQFLKHFQRVRSHAYDLVIDLMNDPRSGLFTLISKGKIKVSTDSSRRFLYHKTYPRAHNSQTYIVAEKFELLRECGFSPQDRRLDFPWFEQHLKPTNDFFQSTSYREGLASKPLRVILSPTHRRPIRKWPLERYCEIARRLVSEWGAKVTWVWGPGEEAEIDEAISRCSVKTYKAPATSFKELAALIASHQLFLGNSNGPSHLAVAADICSLQLHGHTKAVSWCPNNLKHRSIQSPDFGKVKNPTLEKITLELVWEKLEALKPEVRAEYEKQEKAQKKRWDA